MTKELKNIDFQNLVLDFINESKNRFAKQDERFANMENNIDDIKSRLNSHDNKFDKIEAIQERIENKLDIHEAKLNNMDNTLKEYFQLLNSKLDSLERVLTNLRSDLRSDFHKNKKTVNKSLASMNNRLVRLEESNSALR